METKNSIGVKKKETESRNKEVPKILFVCVGNAYRSIMAEAYARKYMKKFHVQSGGIRPLGYIPDEVLEVLREDGIDTSSLYSKPIDPKELAEFDYVVVLANIPFFAPTRVIYYDIEDPAFSSIEFVRKIRDQIKQIILELKDTLR